MNAVLNGVNTNSMASPHCKDHLVALHRMLMHEERQMSTNIRSFDLFNVELGVISSRRAIDDRVIKQIVVPGVGERRPALIVGDSVEIRPATAPHLYKYVAYIVAIRESDIWCDVSPQMNNVHPVENLFHVRFFLCALPISYYVSQS